MALSPTISAVVSNNQTVLTVTDTTGVYDATNNTGGWETPNIAGSDVTAATLDIEFNGTSVQTVDILSQIPATVTGEIEFNAITINSYADGIGKITYTLTTATNTFTYELQVLFLQKVSCCVEKYWQSVIDPCTCKCDAATLLYNANLAEGLLQGLRNAGACLDTNTVSKTLERLAVLCNYNDCNC